jgi:hypothetical protein
MDSASVLLSMNAPISRSFAALVAIGAVAILLLGAFSRFDPAAAPPALAVDSPAEVTIEPAGEPELPANLSPGLAEIIKLAQAHVDANVILDFIHNSGKTYSPTADEILYLSDLGLSQNIIAALFKAKPDALPEIAAVTEPAPVASAASSPLPNSPPVAQDTNAGTFHNALAPYGTWLQIPEYGLCWQPTTVTLNPDWRPYVDQGQWLYTDNNGWYWQSGYSWGWAAFHYGRWSKHDRFGWVWVPDKVWGPAWVSWRIALNYSGWAPLPPGVGLDTVAGLTFNKRRVAADFDFGLPAGWFTFVNEGNFLSRNLPSYAIPASQTSAIYTRSLAVNNYSIANQKVLNLGPGRAGIATVAETQTPSFEMNSVPAQNRAIALEPLIALETEPPPAVAPVFREEASHILPRQRLVLPAKPLLQPEKLPHHQWLEKYPAYPNLAVATRWEPPGNHEFFRHEQAIAPFPTAPQPELARMMAAPASASAKAGR